MIIKLILDRFEGRQAVLKMENGQTIIWPKDSLPSDVKEGNALSFKITTDLEEEKDKKALAKEILNEILDTKE